MPKTSKRQDEAKYRLLPPLDTETHAGLKADIAVNGVQVPVVKDEKGYILDGFARAKIAKGPLREKLGEFVQPVLGLPGVGRNGVVNVSEFPDERDTADLGIQARAQSEDVLSLGMRYTFQDGLHCHVHGGIRRGYDQYPLAHPQPLDDRYTERGRLARTGRSPEEMDGDQGHRTDRRRLFPIQAVVGAPGHGRR
jgi:hypothetical protein